MIVVHYRVPAPGSAWIEEDRVETAMLVEIDGAPHPHVRTRMIKKRVEVFGATAQAVTRARIAYLEHVVVERLDLQERRRPSPLQGKSFVLDTTDGALAVTGPDGAPVAAEDEQAVRAAEKRFGRVDSLPSVLARLDFRPGEVVAVPAEMAAQLFGGEQEVNALELTFVEQRGDEAQFAIVLRMTGTRADVVTRTAVAGTLQVEADTAQLRDMRLIGSVNASGATSAEGTVSMVNIRTAVPARTS